MTVMRSLKQIAAALCLLACAACAPGARDFLQASAYDSQEPGTGSVLPAPGTLTPY